MDRKIRNLVIFLIFVISVAMHWNHFSKDLMSVHVWRQTQTQANIDNFYEEDMNIFNPRRDARGGTDGIFRMEFPLMQWMVAALYKIFGQHLIITRLFMFLIFLLTVLGMHQLLLVIFNKPKLALMGAWAFSFSPNMFYYGVNPLPDNFALANAIWGMALFFTWINKNKQLTLLLSGLITGIAALVKLPFIIFYIVPGIYFVDLIVKKQFHKSHFIQAVSDLGFVLLPLLWYFTGIPDWEENVIVKGMFGNEVPFAELLDYYQHTLFSSIPELFVNYGALLFFIAGFYFLWKRKSFRNYKFKSLLALSITALLYYFFEANAIAKVHDYYLFPFYPLLFILVGYGAFHLYQSGSKIIHYLTLLLLLILPLTAYLRMQDRWDPDHPGFNKDLLKYKTELRNVVPDNSLVSVGNDPSTSIFLYYINKKGFTFEQDHLTGAWLKGMRNEGSEYLYTDSEVILQKPGVSDLLDKMILQKGSIKVFRLKSRIDKNKQIGN